MEQGHRLVFDDFIPGNGTEYRSSAELDQTLGAYDQLALYCVLGDVPAATNTNPGKVYVYLSHSGDGETFVVKNGASGPPPANPEITLTWTSSVAAPTTILTAWGSDPNTTVNPPTPFLRYVRVNVYMTGFSSRVHVKVYATQRDQGA